MKAPKKIYLQKDQEEFQYNTTWSEDEVNETDIMYIRADLVENLIKSTNKETFKKIANDINLVDWLKGE
jgi:hypothetical protein